MIDIIVPHYGDDALLDRCVDSIEANTRVEYTLIVIDNNEDNVGFTKAVNQGIQQGDGDYVMLLNNDTVVPGKWLQRMQMIVEIDDRIAAVGPLSTAPSQWQWVHNMATKLEMDLPANDYITSDIVKFPSQLAFWCTLIPRRVIEDVGLLDEQFVNYCSDDDWCVRAQQAGYKLALDLGTVVEHDHRTNYTPEVKAEHQRSFELFTKKWDQYVTSRPNVYVAVLNQGTIRVELANLLVRSMRKRGDLGDLALCFPNRKPIADNRNHIVLDFLTGERAGEMLARYADEGGDPYELLQEYLDPTHDYLVMCDDDVVPYYNPLDVIPQMEQEGIDICGLPTPIVQYQKSPTNPVFWNTMIYAEEYEPEPWQPINLKGTDEFLEVDAVGTGCIIIHRRVLEHKEVALAPFERGFNELGIAVRGLDLLFCEKAKQAGFKVHTHTGMPAEHWYELPMARLTGLITDSRYSANGAGPKNLEEVANVDNQHTQEREATVEQAVDG